MRNLKAALISVFLVLNSFVFAQRQTIDSFPLQDASCEINFKPSTTVADLESFAKCFVYRSPTVTAQSTLQNNQINFSKLPLLLTNQEFPTMQNTYRQSFLVFGEYDNFFANAKTNNLAFFEANRNTVMSAGNVNYPGVPNF
ncbi:hypothetical protein F0365_01355 [Nonlabens sp. Ci31]|jgi:hypothetical protein|uniref:hypothetical protein n=1 Tax=Nonlabens sp. Ci31 TaxID=2608253 RepID=UPI0014647F43|nr:hypothetical protein [Nonlabens sp. Ci31]QJP33151.1 hypothetical protein F0365_01355 [Nonlabens sp. Ci31]